MDSKYIVNVTFTSGRITIYRGVMELRCKTGITLVTEDEEISIPRSKVKNIFVNIENDSQNGKG